MMKFIDKILMVTAVALLSAASLHAQKFTFSGTITDKSGNPVEFATVVLEGSEQWAVADTKGQFTITNVPAMKTGITVSCLGYVPDSREITIEKDIKNYRITLSEDNLALEGAVVTAQDKSNTATTSRTIDKTALDHVQLMNVGDISALLPGGTTTNNDLTTAKQFNIRSGSSEIGNSAFTTAVEVDGVRLSNNASFNELSSSDNLKGVTTNNIASSNVESVEVITGVPSVEYGDMSSGVVKINTRKGKTPWTITFSTSPKTKQGSVSKGFGLGDTKKGSSRGVLNTSLEWTESISKVMSPYSSYDRKQVSLTYSNLLNRGAFESAPLRITAGVAGNLGGTNTSADPDAIQGTYLVARDNALRGNVTLDWLLSKSWITNIEVHASAVYSDKLTKENVYYSSAINKVVLHGTEMGYYMAEPYVEGRIIPVQSIPHGYWFNEKCLDDKPFSIKAGVKANWAHNFGEINGKLKIGADWNADHNLGRGQYSTDMSTADTFREYRYCDKPMMHNVAAYIEENIIIPVGQGRLNLIAGLRNDNTIIKGSAYGITSSLSPRFNAKYTVLSPTGRSRKTLRELSFRASWGVAVKQPSYSVLYPNPTYRDVNVFNSTTNSRNESFSAYYIEPRTILYNGGLLWQKSRQSEVGADIDIAGNKISLAAFYSRTLNSYMLATDYERTTYNYTSTGDLLACTIPVDNRVFSIDRSSGTVTVSDKTGTLAPETLSSTTYKELCPFHYAANEENPIDRYGLEWVIDFARIKPINTSIRLDGTYYLYKNLSTNMIANSPYTQTSAQDGVIMYPYVGYYYGDHAVSNGSVSKNLRCNLTVTTHIPSVRMIISFKLESTLFRYSRPLSERLDGSERGMVISSRNDYLSTTGESIYTPDRFSVYYPEFYSSFEDATKRNFLEDFKAARASGNTRLETDLRKLIAATNYNYMMNEDVLSPYFSANFSVTKEIGDIASISFYANNFFNNSQMVHSSRNDTYMTSGSYIPKFYYGLTLRLKFQ